MKNFVVIIQKQKCLKKTMHNMGISELVPTVDLGLELLTLCSMAIAGDSPSMFLTFGLFNFPKNCLA